MIENGLSSVVHIGSCVLRRASYVARRALGVVRHSTQYARRTTPHTLRITHYAPLLLIPLLLYTLTFAQETPNRAGLVIRYDDGRVETYCVTFSEPSISGIEMLRRAGVPLITAFDTAHGEAVCKIDGQGCDYPLQPCFCQCQGADCAYWAYYHLQGGEWVYSQVGASSYQVKNGDVEGWAWGSGEPGQGTFPPLYTFDQICALPTPSATSTPTPLPSSTPTATPTVTVPPTPTPSPIPTATPTPTLALRATPTVLPTPNASPAVPPTPIPSVSSIPTVAPTPTPSPTTTPSPIPTPSSISPYPPSPIPSQSPIPNPQSPIPDTQYPTPSSLPQPSTLNLQPLTILVTPRRPNPARVLITPTPTPRPRQTPRRVPGDLVAYAFTLAGLGVIALVVYARDRRNAP